LKHHVAYTSRVNATPLPVCFQAEKSIIGIFRAGGPIMVEKIDAGISRIIRIRTCGSRGVGYRNRLRISAAASLGEGGKCEDKR
jgi:hypothetical protein